MREFPRRRIDLVEWVALVDETGREIGKAEKSEVHHADTPLHRAFSAYLFDASGTLLIQKRALGKPTWPGFWSNSCCGHPAPGEAVLDAARRRLRDELGAQASGLWVALPDYRYRAEWGGIVEHELCPVLVGRIEPERVEPDPDEIEALRWIAWPEWLERLEAEPERHSPWAREQSKLLDSLPAFRAWLGL